MRLWAIASCLLVFIAPMLWRTVAAEPADATTEATLKQEFKDVVQPFLRIHCLSCHGKEKQEAKLDLSGFTSLKAVAGAHQVWHHVIDRLEAEEMPPEDIKQPAEAERSAVIDWIRRARRHEANRHAGDPGAVPVRRLSNVEYDYTIRDITGVDIRPTSTFPVDPANEAGFDNSGESLTISPALLTKYLDAARLVADHLVLAPKDMRFAPHPVVTETDRDKYCVKRIVSFYERQPTDLAE